MALGIKENEKLLKKNGGIPTGTSTTPVGSARATVQNPDASLPDITRGVVGIGTNNVRRNYDQNVAIGSTPAPVQTMEQQAMVARAAGLANRAAASPMGGAVATNNLLWDMTPDVQRNLTDRMRYRNLSTVDRRNQEREAALTLEGVQKLIPGGAEPQQAGKPNISIANPDAASLDSYIAMDRSLSDMSPVVRVEYQKRLRGFTERLANVMSSYDKTQVQTLEQWESLINSVAQPGDELIADAITSIARDSKFIPPALQAQIEVNDQNFSSFKEYYNNLPADQRPRVPDALRGTADDPDANGDGVIDAGEAWEFQKKSGQLGQLVQAWRDDPYTVTYTMDPTGKAVPDPMKSFRLQDKRAQEEAQMKQTQDAATLKEKNDQKLQQDKSYRDYVEQWNAEADAKGVARKVYIGDGKIEDLPIAVTKEEKDTSKQDEAQLQRIEKQISEAQEAIDAEAIVTDKEFNPFMDDRDGRLRLQAKRAPRARETINDWMQRRELLVKKMGLDGSTVEQPGQPTGAPTAQPAPASRPATVPPAMAPPPAAERRPGPWRDDAQSPAASPVAPAAPAQSAVRKSPSGTFEMDKPENAPDDYVPMVNKDGALYYMPKKSVSTAIKEGGKVVSYAGEPERFYAIEQIPADVMEKAKKTMTFIPQTGRLNLTTGAMMIARQRATDRVEQMIGGADVISDKETKALYDKAVEKQYKIALKEVENEKIVEAANKIAGKAFRKTYLASGQQRDEERKKALKATLSDLAKGDE